jgi:hypothetical protein
MKKIVFIILLLPIYLAAQEKTDNLNKKIDSLENQIVELKSKYEYQDKLNEQTITSISNQISAASYNLTIFGILFTISALALGVYVTVIEKKIGKIKDENKSLLSQSLAVKEEVVSINNLIQKDIYGLFLKIKREETIHILKRLSQIPEDISNFSKVLLSRELEKEDYLILREAYLRLNKLQAPRPLFSFVNEMTHKDLYKLLFFQHFLDLVIKDEKISLDMIDFYPNGITCAFENDILKSTSDFIKSIIDLGYQSKEKDINSYIKGLSESKFKDLQKVYEIIFNGFKDRNDRFKFYQIISDEKECRVGKSNYGRCLIAEYANTELSITEKAIIEQTIQIKADIQKEAEEKEIEEKRNA